MTGDGAIFVRVFQADEEANLPTERLRTMKFLVRALPLGKDPGFPQKLPSSAPVASINSCQKELHRQPTDVHIR